MQPSEIYVDGLVYRAYGFWTNKGETDMTKATGNTYMNSDKTVLVEITKITKSGRIKFAVYANGKKLSYEPCYSEKEFDKFYPVFVANA